MKPITEITEDNDLVDSPPTNSGRVRQINPKPASKCTLTHSPHNISAHITFKNRVLEDIVNNHKQLCVIPLMRKEK